MILNCQIDENMWSVNTIITLSGSIIIPIIIGFITYVIAKKQITGTSITQFRQQWINSLRNSVSAFIAKAEYTVIQTDHDNIKETFKELVEAGFKVEMLLNPDEDDHKHLVEQIRKIRFMIYEDEEAENTIDSEVEELLIITKKVLKREWNVVKSGK